MASGVSLDGYKASDGFSGSATLASNKVSVTGTFTQQPDGVGEKLGFPEEMNTGFFLPVKLTGIRGQAIKRMPDGRINVFGKTGDTSNTMNIILAVDPESPTIQFKLYSTLDDAQNDKDGLPITIDCSQATFIELLLHDSQPPKAEQLQESVGEHTVADLIGKGYSVVQTKDGIKVLGEVKPIADLQDTFLDEAELTQWYLPLVLEGNEGNVLKYTSIADQEVKKTFGTDGVVAVAMAAAAYEAKTPAKMLLVLPIDKDEPTQELKVYVDDSAAISDLDPQIITIDASECVFKEFLYEPEDAETLKAALKGNPQLDDKIHIKLAQPITLTEVIKVEKDAVIDLNSNKLTTANGISLNADTTIKNGEFESTAPVGFLTDSAASHNITLEGLTYNFKPAKKHSTLELTQAVRLHTSTDIQPNVTIKDCIITAQPAPDSSTLQTLAIASIDNSTGNGTLTLDNSTLNITGGGKAMAIMCAAPNSTVAINNGSKINSDLDAIMVLYDADITVDGATITSPYTCVFGSTSDNTILGKNSNVTITNSTIKATNPLSSGAANNISTILFNGGDNNTVTIDEATNIALTGGNTSANNEYLAAYYKGKKNKIEVNGTVTTAKNVLKMLAIHSQADGDTLYYDSRSDGDTIEFGDDAAKKFYKVLDAEKIVNVTEDVTTAIKVAKLAQKGDTDHAIIIKRGAEALEAGQVELPTGITLE